MNDGTETVSTTSAAPSQPAVAPASADTQQAGTAPGANASAPGATNSAQTDGGQQTGAEGARGTERKPVLTPPDRKAAAGAEGAKPAQGETPSEGAAPAAADPLDVVPEDGTYALTLPEGMKLDEALLGEASPVFKDAGLTVRQANKLAAFFGELRAKEAKQRADDWQAITAGWEQQTLRDPEYATVGFKAAQETANRALAQFGTPELDAALASTGMDSHPEMVRLFYRIGKAMADDTTERGTGGVDAQVTMETRMYGATTPNTKRT